METKNIEMLEGLEIQKVENPNFVSLEKQIENTVDPKDVQEISTFSKKQKNNKEKTPVNEVNHKYSSIEEFRQTFKSQQLELLEKVERTFVFLFVFKINHSMFKPTIEGLECISKVQEQKGWELKIGKEEAKKLLIEGLPNNMNAKIQLSNKNFYLKENGKNISQQQNRKYREIKSNKTSGNKNSDKKTASENQAHCWGDVTKDTEIPKVKNKTNKTPQSRATKNKKANSSNVQNQKSIKPPVRVVSNNPFSVFD